MHQPDTPAPFRTGVLMEASVIPSDFTGIIQGRGGIVQPALYGSPPLHEPIIAVCTNDRGKMEGVGWHSLELKGDRWEPYDTAST